MFGVSRERIRQLAERHGAVRAKGARGLMAVREWNDELNRFIPVSRSQLKKREAVKRRAARKQKTLALREKRKAWLAQQLRELAQQLGRTPTLVELAEVFGAKTGRASTPNIGTLYAFMLPGAKRSYRAISADLYAAAGLTVRATGGPGHINRLHRKREAA